MITQQLIPSVEKRISAWKDIKEKKVDLTESSPANITISREFGCEGYPLAESLRDLLEKQSGSKWMIYDDAAKSVSNRLYKHFDSWMSTHFPDS